MSHAMLVRPGPRARLIAALTAAAGALAVAAGLAAGAILASAVPAGALTPAEAAAMRAAQEAARGGPTQYRTAPWGATPRGPQRHGDVIYFDRAPTKAELERLFPKAVIDAATGRPDAARPPRAAGPQRPPRVGVAPARDLDPPTLPARGPQHLTLAIGFSLNSAALDYQDALRLASLGAFLAERPEIRLLVAGHADASGDARYNLDLSRRRAEAVRAHLVHALGVAPGRLTAAGYGEYRLLPGLHPYDARNRRVEFRLVQ